MSTRTTRGTCPLCGALAARFHRYCNRHAHRMTRYGDPKGKPVIYREHIKPSFHGWIADGFARWRDTDALKACVKLADKLLHYTEPTDTLHAGYLYCQRGNVARLMKEMREAGVTPEALFCRVCEYYAYFERHPERAASHKVEKYALARGVLHMLHWRLRSKRVGARTLELLGFLIQEVLGMAALAFVRRLDQDDQEAGELKKRAITFV